MLVKKKIQSTNFFLAFFNLFEMKIAFAFAIAETKTEKKKLTFAIANAKIFSYFSSPDFAPFMV